MKKLLFLSQELSTYDKWRMEGCIYILCIIGSFSRASLSLQEVSEYYK